MKRSSLVAAMAVSFGCASPSPPSPPPPSPPAVVAPSAPAPVTSAPSVDASAPPPVVSAPPPSADVAPPESPSTAVAATPGPGEVALDSLLTPIDDFAAWMSMHKLRAEAINCAISCGTLAIAGPTGDLIAGSVVTMDGGGGLAEESIHLVTPGAHRVVFSIPQSVMTDLDGSPRFERTTYAVTIFVRDGRDLVVVPAGDSCSAKTSFTGKVQARIAAMCRAVGVYRWNGARFGRVADARKTP